MEKGSKSIRPFPGDGTEFTDKDTVAKFITTSEEGNESIRKMKSSEKIRCLRIAERLLYQSKLILLLQFHCTNIRITMRTSFIAQ